MKERRTDRTARSRNKACRADRRQTRPLSPALARLILLTAIALLALAGCGSLPGSPETDLIPAINTGDLDGALRLFAADAVVRIDRSAPFSGEGEIEAWLEHLFADNLALDQVEVVEQGGRRLVARYRVTSDPISALGLASLDGTGEMRIYRGRITALYFDLSEASQGDLLDAMVDRGTPVLSYGVQTDPDPVRASPGGTYDPNRASLTVAITNDTGELVTVRSITLLVPEGHGARDLTPNISGVDSEAPIRWHLTKREGRFTLAPELPKDGQLEAGEGLFIRLSEIEINDQPGVWGLGIAEETGEATTGSMTIQLAKFPFALSVGDLAADPLVVDAPGSTTLFWEGSDGATYTLLYDDTVTDVTGMRSYLVEGITETTTFYLTVTPVGGEDLPPVIRERTVTVKP